MFSNSKNILFAGGTFTEHHQHSSYISQDPSEIAMDRLMSTAALGALHNSGERFNPPKCHPNTRTAVFENLMKWFLRDVGWNFFVLWLYGPAGAGKSAIAQTFAELYSKENGLLASFFFSRSDNKRNNEKALVATLVYQVALHIPQFWDLIKIIIFSHPGVFELSIQDQFDLLLFNPLFKLGEAGLFESRSVPYLFLIDGLDECQNSGIQKTILITISNAIRTQLSSLPFVFFIASRPEHHISHSFSTSLNDITFRLALDDTYQPKSDIKLYLEHSFKEIRDTHIMQAHIPPTWPCRDDISKIVEKSSGQFIYAATVIRYVSSHQHNPQDRLRIVHRLLAQHGDRPFAELDALYNNILSCVADINGTLDVIGIFLACTEIDKPLNVRKLERFMGLTPGSIKLLFIDLLSVIDVSGEDQGIRFLHASFSDFLLDPIRSLRFHIKPAKMHAHAARLCMVHINALCSHPYIHPAENKFSLNEMAPIVLASFLKHLQLSGTLHDDPRLWHDILSLPYFKFLKTCNAEPDVLHDLDFLLFLKTSDVYRREELYIHHCSIWDEYARGILASTYRKSELLCWLSIISCLTNTPNEYKVHNATISAISTHMQESENSFNLAMSIYSGYMLFPSASNSLGYWRFQPSNPNRYSKFMIDFFRDPSRARSWVVGEGSCSIACETLFQFATRPWDDKKEKIDSSRMRDRQWGFIWEAIISILPKAGYSENLSILSAPTISFYLQFPSTGIWRVDIDSLIQRIGDYSRRWGGVSNSTSYNLSVHMPKPKYCRHGQAYGEGIRILDIPYSKAVRLSDGTRLYTINSTTLEQ